MKPPVFLLALLLGSPSVGWAIGPDAIYCGPGFSTPPLYAPSVTRQCAGGSETIRNFCMYTLPCYIVTDELKAQAAQAFGGRAWGRLTDVERQQFAVRSGLQPQPTVVSCSGGRTRGDSVVCPPVLECISDVQQMRVAAPGQVHLDPNEVRSLDPQDVRPFDAHSSAGGT